MNIWLDWGCMTNWINVKDRLPEEGKRVLVYIVNPNNIFIDKVTNPKEGNIWGFISKEYITHWAPLPEPPETIDKNHIKQDKDPVSTCDVCKKTHAECCCSCDCDVCKRKKNKLDNIHVQKKYYCPLCGVQCKSNEFFCNACLKKKKITNAKNQDPDKA